MKSDRNRLSEDSGQPFRDHTLLAPAGWHQVHRFRDLVVDQPRHAELIEAIQRFRGNAYLEDGAIRPSQLTPDGRHFQSIDSDSWHLLTQDEHGAILSCARYYPVADARFESTLTAQSALAQSPLWHEKVKDSVDSSIGRASARGAVFAELGGWCVASSARNSTQALRTVLLMYALGEVLGGTVGLSTATRRHSSASILQRLGATRAQCNGEVLPAYFEPLFACEMELLQFDSLYPAPRYASQVAGYTSMMKLAMPVVCSHSAQPTCLTSLTNLSQALTPAVRLKVRAASQSA